MLKLLRFLTQSVCKVRLSESHILLEECLDLVASTTIVRCNSTVYSLIMHEHPVCAGVIFPDNFAHSTHPLMTPECAKHLLLNPHSISIISRTGLLGGLSDYSSDQLVARARATFPRVRWPETKIVKFELSITGTYYSIAFVKHTAHTRSKIVSPIMMNVNDLF